MSDRPTRNQRLMWVMSSSTDGGPKFHSYQVMDMQGGKVVITLPHSTTRRKLAERLRAMADEIEPVAS